MMKLQTPVFRLLFALSIAAVCCTQSAVGQIKALRNNDDQFIQGLREQGMSDLLQHFVETSPPEDPIAKLALKVALQQFIADDLLERATQANQNNDAATAVALFEQSRQAYQEVLAAQKQLTNEHQDDERLPIWQTDYAQMLLFRYLPNYYQKVDWVYEFGMPTAEQREAYESAMVEAFKATADASYRHDIRANRVAADAALRPKLEEMGIWFRLEEYQQINTPYWLAHSAHGVSLLPDSHPYFQNKSVRNQKLDPPAEKKRLRYLVVEALSYTLSDKDWSKMTAKLLSGRTLVWSDDIDDIDEGVELLEGVISAESTEVRGFLATLGKAVGRWKAGELDVALPYLEGMGRNKYVEGQMEQGNIAPRLLAADLLFKILNTEAMKAPPSKQPQLVAQAYEKAYVEMIDGNADPRFKAILFERWAAEAGEVQDPGKLPPAVRMGIGEQLTNQAGAEAERIVQIMTTRPPVVPAELEKIKRERDAVVVLLDRAVLFNKSLTGEEMEGPVLARGLYNLGMNLFNLARLEQAFNNGNADLVKFQDVAELWVQIGERVADASQTKEALIYAMSLMSVQDQRYNKESATQPRVRDIYRRAFELLNARWPQEPPVHNQRVYAGFYLYEKTGDLDKAVEVYRALPGDHNDYYKARRQMIYVLQRQFRHMTDRKRLMEATQPPSTAPIDATAEQKAELEQAKLAWEAEHDALLEDLVRLRDDIVEEAELVILDAEEVVEDNNASSALRFTAATAIGASKVVLAGVESERGDTKKALGLLEGFEAEFSPQGKYAQLAALQADPDGAKANLQGLVQSAQQQRILALLEAGQIQDMVDQARKMMDAAPDVAAAVINGVLQQIRTTIDRERRAEREAAFDRQREDARKKIQFQANAAVALGKLLVQWATAQGYDQKKMSTYRMPLADSLVLAGRGTDALQIMLPIVKQFPTNFDIRMKTGRAYIAVYRKNKTLDNYNGAIDMFAEIIKYYNIRPEKPDHYWDAWLQICTLKDIAGGDRAKELPEHARMLTRVDENLGGPNFKQRFLAIFDRNGGIEQLPQRN